MSGLRDVARRLAPASARAWVRRLRKAAKGPPIFETELGAYRLAADPTPAPRLTLVMPSLSRAAAFGGVTTGLDIFRAVAAELRASGPLDLRIATTDPGGIPDDPLLSPEDGVELLPRRTRGAEMPTRPNEIFLAYNWHAAANLAPLLAAQAAHFGVAPRPLVYLVQEYEPGFFPFSADHLLIRWALEPGWPVHAVVNSSLLSDWLDRQGHVFEKKHVFEPRLNPALKPFLPGRGARKTKRILVYGRPLENRNCWPILRRGLEIWAREHPGQSDWQVISAGAEHAPLRLAGGRRVSPVGKLSLEDYGRLLAETAVGVSLMASPHPSYPPLEMAHFGLRVLSNRYGDKDLSRLHDNIASLADPRPETLAAALAETCAAFEADPGAGARGVSRLPGYLDGAPFPPAPAIAADLAALLRG